MKFTSIHKKIRGMRRKRNKLVYWSQKHKELDVAQLKKYEKDYVKLWISPFYNLYQYSKNKVDRRTPPHWFNKLILNEMLDIYLSWKEELDAIGEPYYLRLWIADPKFIDSQLVTALGDQINYYENIFIEHKDQKGFPYKYGINRKELKDFEWKRCINGYYVWESDLETLEEIEDIKRKSIQTNEFEIQGNLERSYFICTGDMWVGHIQGSGNFT